LPGNVKLDKKVVLVYILGRNEVAVAASIRRFTILRNDKEVIKGYVCNYK
jgi:hypothetical protein